MMGAEPSAGPLARPVRSLSSAAAPPAGPPPAEPPPPSPRPRAASKLRGAGKAQRGSAGKSKKNPAQKAFSCHYCRQKRADIVTCPKHTEGHRWCGSCVRNHLGLDIEKIRRNKDKIWPDGCPRCTKTCTCSHCRVRIGGKRKGEFSDGLEEEYETLLRDQHEAKLAAGGSDSRGTSCHYCRQKKSLFVECNKSRFHRWCSSCVKNGFGLDFGELLRNKDKVWPMGCPICQKTCTCSLCKRRALAKAQKNGGDNELANALMGISAENRKPPPRARRPKAPKTLPGSGPGFGRRQMDLPPSARAGSCKSDRCHGACLMDMREEQSLVDENGEDQEKLPHAMTVASFNTVMAQGSPTGASGERESDQTKDAGLLLDMLAQACDGPESSPSPAKDMQMAPTSFFAAAAAQESAKAHFADLASSPRQQQAAAAPAESAVPMEREQAEDPQQPAPGEPAQPPPDCQDKLPPPAPAALPAAAAVSSGDAASASSAEAEAPEGSPCPSTGSDSPPFSPSLAPGENGEQPTELQLPQSPRAGNSPRYHRHNIEAARPLTTTSANDDGMALLRTLARSSAAAAGMLPQNPPKKMKMFLGERIGPGAI